MDKLTIYDNRYPVTLGWLMAHERTPAWVLMVGPRPGLHDWQRIVGWDRWSETPTITLRLLGGGYLQCAATLPVYIRAEDHRAHFPALHTLTPEKVKEMDDSTNRDEFVKKQLKGYSEILNSFRKPYEDTIRGLRKVIAQAALAILDNAHGAIVDTLWLDEEALGPTLYELLCGHLPDVALDGGTDEEDKAALRAFISKPTTN